MCFASWSLWKWTRLTRIRCYFCRDKTVVFESVERDITDRHYMWFQYVSCPYCLARMEKRVGAAEESSHSFAACR